MKLALWPMVGKALVAHQYAFDSEIGYGVPLLSEGKIRECAFSKNNCISNYLLTILGLAFCCIVYIVSTIVYVSNLCKPKN